MKLYTTPKGRWAGTQADAKEIGKEDGGWREDEVPTDKPGLLAFLNEHSVGAEIAVRGQVIDDAGSVEPRHFAALGQDAVEEEAHLRAATPEQIAAANPNSGLPKAQAFDRQVGFEIAVEEHIQSAGYPRLATLAQNVAWRFEELANTAKAKPVPSVFDTPEDAADDDDDPLLA